MKIVFILLLFPILSFSQKTYKFKEKGPNLFLTDKKGNHLDTIMNMTSGEDIKVFFLDERIFKVDVLCSMRSISTFIEEYYIDNSKFILKRNIHLKTDGCLEESYHKFKIKIKKGRIIWKLRRDGKTYKGEYTLKEFETLKFLELPESVCDEEPYAY